jgi:alpha-N-arabinofuranosidase
MISKSACVALLIVTLLISTLQAQSTQPAATLTIHLDKPGATINPNIYGQFSEHLGRCIYEGIWVGKNSPIPNTRGIRNDVVAALKQLHVPVLRWPGGCFADEYHWRDGIGPRAERPKRINTHWGGVIETNAFGTHEFLDLCEQVGCEPYICGNVGSGTVQEMMEWIEYMTSDSDSTLANLRRQNGREKPWKIKYFGVGNESWGCGGSMTAEFYADQFKRYGTFVKNFSGNRVSRFACGASGGDYHWTEVLMSQAARNMDGLSLHYYSIPTGEWRHKGPDIGFDEQQWFGALSQTLQMEDLITKHSAIMDKYDPKKRVGLIIDEWGLWYDPQPGSNPGFLYKQNTLRDALAAAINLNIFNSHSDRVAMTNIAQMINVLQAMILTDKEKMLLTPTYHVFEMYKVHQGATSIAVEIESPKYTNGEKSVPAVHASASKDVVGKIHLSLVNVDPNREARITAVLQGLASAKTVSGRVLTSRTMDAHNTFDQPQNLKPVEFTGAELKDGAVNATLPAKSVVVLEVQ